MPPLSGTGICCKRPLEKYGPSSPLMRATSRAPNRSGHISVPSRSSISSSGNFSPFSSRPRGSCQPSTVTQCRRCSYCIGIIRWHQSPDHSLLRICPLTSSSCSRCMMTISGDFFGSFRRVVESSFHHVRAVLRSASLSASSVLWGSSTTMMSPPIPSNEPPTDVASLEPPALVSNFVLVFWSSRNLKRCPHSDWYHGLRMSRRVELLLVSDKSWLYEPHRKRTCGPFRNIRCDCAHTHAGKKIEATVVFAHLGGKFTSRCLISPFTTACRCSHNASIAQQR